MTVNSTAEQYKDSIKETRKSIRQIQRTLVNFVLFLPFQFSLTLFILSKMRNKR